VLAFGSIAVSPQERMGSLPVSRSSIVLLVKSVKFLIILSILQKPVHFCRYSVVISFVFSTDELTQSEGGMLGKL